jgi:CheY-like chemotaxis protein
VRESFGRTLRDIAQLLESTEASDARIARVLDLVLRVVPGRHCALFETQRPMMSRLLVAPVATPDVRAALFETLVVLHARLVDEQVHALDARAVQSGPHLVFPLVGKDELIGVLLVSGPIFERCDSVHTEQDLRDLALVGSLLAVYLVMVDQAQARSVPVDAPKPGQRPLSGIRVLLVDDDTDMLLATGTVLEHYGAEVTSAESVGAALAALELARPHVLLSDVSIPGRGGYDLMRELGARGVALPAAALTSRVKEEDRMRAYAAGFRMHLAKPFGAQALVAAVASLGGRES